MNWKIRFWKLIDWRPKNDEERWRIFMKSLMETSRRHYGGTSAWIFFTETIFLTNFERILKYQKGWTIYSALFPLFIGEKREVVVAQLPQASKVASTRRHRLLLEPPRRTKWAWLLFAPPLFTKCTPPCVFLFIPFWNVMELYGLRNDTHFLSKMLWNFTNYATMLFLTSGMLRNFMDCATMLVFDFRNFPELYGLPNDGC